ncbi:MAG: acetyl-CoA carboxylase biotin carboxyl carrier protein subunit [Clostridia bacterium]|nr:acetyl-CoA carboxylase biotin carboxyl carrier protein subunit [Clostridia bacterium]
MTTKKLKITVLGKSYEVLVEDLGEVTDVVTPAPDRTPQASVLPIDTPALTEVTAPLSGTILEVVTHVGDTVQAGDRLCVLEAMKVQNVLPAPVSGMVRQILISKGDAVDAGAVLITIEA